MTDIYLQISGYSSARGILCACIFLVSGLIKSLLTRRVRRSVYSKFISTAICGASWDGRGSACSQDSGPNFGPSLVHCTRQFSQHEYNQQYNILELEVKRSTSREILEKKASRDQMYKTVENTL